MVFILKYSFIENILNKINIYNTNKKKISYKYSIKREENFLSFFSYFYLKSEIKNSTSSFQLFKKMIQYFLNKILNTLILSII
jgi:hypothetical protein